MGVGNNVTGNRGWGGGVVVVAVVVKRPETEPICVSAFSEGLDNDEATWQVVRKGLWVQYPILTVCNEKKIWNILNLAIL